MGRPVRLLQMAMFGKGYLCQTHFNYRSSIPIPIMIMAFQAHCAGPGSIAVNSNAAQCFVKAAYVGLTSTAFNSYMLIALDPGSIAVNRCK